ncbi:MAG: hypothetical protein Q4A82_04895 [Corynebacterium sp.]|nr:hypothetical protein [Corynebacterium sp.]
MMRVPKRRGRIRNTVMSIAVSFTTITTPHIAHAAQLPNPGAINLSGSSSGIIQGLQALLETLKSSGIFANTPTSDDTPASTIVAPQTTPPSTPYFLAASFPKITSDPASTHQVAFSYMHNSGGNVVAVTGGQWSGTINGKKLANFMEIKNEAGVPTGLFALEVKEADLKDINVTFTKDGTKTTLKIADPQLNRESQTTLFVPGNNN